ncbi:collagen alpha-1(I) chain-like [Ovis aries]|uniref:collagen alpha-1(I) chain-like n=1 Tax=Ovis aries TaxID=9940 RepID=UPI001C2E0EDE|nr:collagen alpha-1(I) chain-like [Ovis aries]
MELSGWPLGGGRGPPGRQRAACFPPGFRGVSTRPHREGAGPGQGVRAAAGGGAGINGPSHAAAAKRVGVCAQSRARRLLPWAARADPPAPQSSGTRGHNLGLPSGVPHPSQPPPTPGRCSSAERAAERPGTTFRRFKWTHWNPLQMEKFMFNRAELPTDRSCPLCKTGTVTQEGMPTVCRHSALTPPPPPTVRTPEPDCHQPRGQAPSPFHAPVGGPGDPSPQRTSAGSSPPPRTPQRAALKAGVTLRRGPARLRREAPAPRPGPGNRRPPEGAYRPGPPRPPRDGASPPGARAHLRPVLRPVVLGPPGSGAGRPGQRPPRPPFRRLLLGQQPGPRPPERPGLANISGPLSGARGALSAGPPPRSCWEARGSGKPAGVPGRRWSGRPVHTALRSQTLPPRDGLLAEAPGADAGAGPASGAGRTARGVVGWEASAFRPASTGTLLTTPLGASAGPEPDQPVLPRAPARSFCAHRKPPPRSLLRALGFGAIREPERVTSLNGADGMVAGFPSPCPAPAGGPGPLCPPPGPAGAWCQPLSPGQPVSAAGAISRLAIPRDGTLVLSPSRGDPSQIRAGASPGGACSRFQGWVEDGRGGGNGGPGAGSPVQAAHGAGPVPGNALGSPCVLSLAADCWVLLPSWTLGQRVGVLVAPRGPPANKRMALSSALGFSHRAPHPQTSPPALATRLLGALGTLASSLSAGSRVGRSGPRQRAVCSGSPLPACSSAAEEAQVVWPWAAESGRGCEDCGPYCPPCSVSSPAKGPKAGKGSLLLGTAARGTTGPLPARGIQNAAHSPPEAPPGSSLYPETLVRSAPPQLGTLMQLTPCWKEAPQLPVPPGPRLLGPRLASRIPLPGSVLSPVDIHGQHVWPPSSRGGPLTPGLHHRRACPVTVQPWRPALACVLLRPPPRAVSSAGRTEAVGGGYRTGEGVLTLESGAEAEGRAGPSTGGSRRGWGAQAWPFAAPHPEDPQVSSHPLPLAQLSSLAPQACRRPLHEDPRQLRL